MARALASQPARFVINGLAATVVHYATLALCLHLLRIPSAGLSNVIAASVGITASFLGNRHFVFRAATQPWFAQLKRFWVLYAALALLQGLILYLWSDLAGLDYRIGFCIGIVIQAVCTYFGGRQWVFRPRS